MWLLTGTVSKSRKGMSKLITKLEVGQTECEYTKIILAKWRDWRDVYMFYMLRTQFENQMIQITIVCWFPKQVFHIDQEKILFLFFFSLCQCAKSTCHRARKYDLAQDTYEHWFKKKNLEC